MIIIKQKKYQKDFKKNIIDKHLEKEKDRLLNIENLIINSKNLQSLMNSPYKNIYNIEQKKGNLKEYFTAHINQKLRLVMKPIGEYPYNILEIVEIEFVGIDIRHYGEG